MTSSWATKGWLSAICQSIEYIANWEPLSWDTDNIIQSGKFPVRCVIYHKKPEEPLLLARRSTMGTQNWFVWAVYGHPAPGVQKLLFQMPCNCKSMGKAMSHMLFMQCMGFKHIVEEIWLFLWHLATLAATVLPCRPLQTSAQSLDLADVGLEVARKDVLV